MPARSQLQQNIATIMALLHRGFDATTTWVTQLSWWKFFLFAAVSLAAANILQDQLFSSTGEEVVVRAEHDEQGKKKKARKPEGTILIDESGIHFNPGKPVAPPIPPTPPEAGEPDQGDQAEPPSGYIGCVTRRAVPCSPIPSPARGLLRERPPRVIAQ